MFLSRKACLDKIKHPINTLDLIKRGLNCRVVDVLGCDKAPKRLRELGIYKGASILVVKNDTGPLIIQLSGNKVAIGRCLANKIIVEKGDNTNGRQT